MTPPKFIALCNKFMCEINKKIDATFCGTKGCLYQVCPNPHCRRIIENLSYCKYGVAVSKSLRTNDGTYANGFERTFNPENNEDCVSNFQEVGDENNVTSTNVTI